MIGTEFIGVTAKRFGSRENAVAANRPALTVEFSPPGVPALSDKGLIVLALVSCVLGVWVMRYWKDTSPDDRHQA